MTRVRRAAAWTGVVVALMVLSGPLAGVAGAHATLIESTPGNDEVVAEAPSRVTLRFDEGVNVDDEGVKVLSADGDRVDSGPPDVRDGGRLVEVDVDDGGVGTYTVSYRVLSDDGHVISGAYVYHVGERTGSAAVVSDDDDITAATVLGGIGRWLGFAGALLCGGVLAVALFVDRQRLSGGSPWWRRAICSCPELWRRSSARHWRCWRAQPTWPSGRSRAPSRPCPTSSPRAGPARSPACGWWWRSCC